MYVCVLSSLHTVILVQGGLGVLTSMSMSASSPMSASILDYESSSKVHYSIFVWIIEVQKSMP